MIRFIYIGGVEISLARCGQAISFALVARAFGAIGASVMEQNIPVLIVVDAVIAAFVDHFVRAPIAVVVDSIGVAQAHVLLTFVDQAIPVVVDCVVGNLAGEHVAGDQRTALFAVAIVIDSVEGIAR